eukprot:1184370-Prorocentrum_minimum.AAC.2
MGRIANELMHTFLVPKQYLGFMFPFSELSPTVVWFIGLADIATGGAADPTASQLRTNAGCV